MGCLVLDFKTGQRIQNTRPNNLIDQHKGTRLEPIASLAMRWDTDINTVFPKAIAKVNKKGQLVIKTYSGNVHTGIVPQHNDQVGRAMPLPLDMSGVLQDWQNQGQVSHLLLEDECFMWMDRKYKNTLNLLDDLIKIASKSDILKTITIRTRSDLFSHDIYLERLQRLKSLEVEISFNLYGMSISEAENRHKWPGAPSVLRRKKALDKATETLNLNHKLLKSGDNSN